MVEETSRTVVCNAIQKTLDRTVILRILKQEAAANPAEVAHFLSIARKFARIKSDSIAPVFDIVSEGDLHYVAMEHVEGPTLEELVSACGPLPIEQVLRIAASLAGSLDQIWESARIVHRNLKSATIRLDPRGVAKITDFSLAIMAGPGVDATAMDSGLIVGTPCFLSPEQAQGSHTLNTQSDMYALGAVIYHLATGVVPFEGQDAVSVLSSHVKRQIPPPHHLNPSIPVSFSWFVHRLMMKNPNNRYNHWSDVLRDIRMQLEGSVPSCVRPEEEYLSTIDALFEADDPGARAKGDDHGAPRIRLNRKEKNDQIASYQSKKIVDEHAQEIRQENLIKELVLWGICLVWLALVFWFRAVYQTAPAQPEETKPLARLAEAVAQLAEPADGDVTVIPDEPTPLEAIKEPLPPPPLTDDEAPPKSPVAAPAPKPPVAAPAVAVKTPAAAPQAPLPAGIPEALARDLAQAFAKGDLAQARQIAKTSAARFQEKEALNSLLERMPQPDALVAEYLQSQIGKPLIFEHNGKQRTVIPRDVVNGTIHIEANGRGAELPIEKLSADEKLRWMNKPKDEAQCAAYCLTLMRSSHRAELAARAAGCPLLAPILSLAADLVPSATPPAE